LGAIVGNWF